MYGVSILPKRHLNLIKGNAIHMALAHLLGRKGYEAYTDFYMNESINDSYVIMDNGVIEGDQRPMSELVEKALKYKMDELILPDVFCDGIASARKTLEAMEELKVIYAERPEALKLRLMIVPQGESLYEWLECLKTIIDNAPIDYHVVGIPKVLVKLLGNRARLQACELLEEQGYLRSIGFDVHLLGCHNNALEPKMIQSYAAQHFKYVSVRSCDSALPYVYARNNCRLDECDRPDQAAIDFDGWLSNESILQENIEFWQNECAGKPTIEENEKVTPFNFADR